LPGLTRRARVAGVSKDEAPAGAILGLMVRDAAKRPLLTMRRNAKGGALVSEICERRRVKPLSNQLATRQLFAFAG
jgi:hypothetical protein